MRTADQSRSEESSKPLPAGEYLWVRPGRFSAAWDLMFSGEKILTLSPPKSFGRMVYFEYMGESFAIKKGGIRSPGAEVRIMSSDISVLSLQQISLTVTEMTGSGNYTLSRKEGTETWTLESEGTEIFTAERDCSGRLPSGRISLFREVLPEVMASSWFLIFTDESP